MNLKKLSDKNLQRLKNEVAEEISYRDRQKEYGGRAFAGFMNVLNDRYFTQEGINQYDVLARLTKERFSRFRNVGKTTLKIAEQELAKRGLKFNTIKE